jgi:hypothetical protein
VDGQNYKVKAKAVFVTYSLTPREVGYYHFDFTFRGKWAEAFQWDKTRYSREEAKQASEFAFNSGRVEAYASRQVKSWLCL